MAQNQEQEYAQNSIHARCKSSPALFDKSVDYIKTAVSDPARSTYSGRDFSEASVISSEDYFDVYLRGARNVLATGYDKNGEAVKLSVDFDFSDDNDFQYFTSDSFLSDGTFSFIKDGLHTLISRVCLGNTYFSQSERPKNGDHIHYTIGNFVVLYEYDEDGTKFSPADKPWMTERTTIMLPLIYTKK